MGNQAGVQLQAAGVRYTAGRTEVWALRNLDIAIGGGLTVVSGVSGSGKSTLLSLLGLLRRPTEGTVTFFGHQVDSLDATAMDRLRAECVGFAFQDHALVPHLSLLENVMLPLLAQHPQAQTQQARAILERVGLALQMERLPSEVSFGQAQRAALCRALARSPQIVLADEVTASLDAGSAEIILGMLREAVSKGVAVVLATHDERLCAVADAVIRLEDGVMLR